jgi:hypothetical protein
MIVPKRAVVEKNSFHFLVAVQFRLAMAILQWLGHDVEGRWGPKRRDSRELPLIRAFGSSTPDERMTSCHVNTAIKAEVGVRKSFLLQILEKVKLADGVLEGFAVPQLCQSSEIGTDEVLADALDKEESRTMDHAWAGAGHSMLVWAGLA